MLLAEGRRLTQVNRIRKNPRGLISGVRHPQLPQPVNQVLPGDLLSHYGPSPSLGAAPGCR